MDSITQIVLGAACGEAVLGKKIGNKALLFGAIGGTIPDLDVFVGSILYDNQIQAMAFHRGFMHSAVFAILGAFGIGWLVFKLYDKGKRKSSTNLNDWRKLFFWSLLTHPLLDCFTPYGTQLFYPFSDHRVALNNIAVADPLYTLPFLICIIVLMFYRRQSRRRQLWLRIGIFVSSTYMLFTLGNKIYVDKVFNDSLAKQGIKAKRFRTQPTILNNILWYGVAETEDNYYLGFYSLFDSEATVNDWKIISKSPSIIDVQNEDLKTLAWFSDDYFKVFKTAQKGVYKYNDLRYALLNPDDAQSSLFSFRIYNNNGRWDMQNSRPDFDENQSFEDVFGPMINRLKGK